MLSKGEDPDGDAATFDVLAALEAFGPIHPDPEAFLECLEPLQPRLYSISSSPLQTPGEMHLTVDAVRYDIAGRTRLGVASTFFADRLRAGAALKVYLQKAHAFGLPDDAGKPIIMVGPGTGIAPFRSFLWQRHALKAPGKSWLFFGHQREASDFFYRQELETLARAGTLTRLSTAWSRDGAQKVYVQDRMREAGAELWAWLRGGRAFLCVRRRQAHGQGRRDGPAGYRHGAWRQERDCSEGLSRGLEEGRALPGGRLLMAACGKRSGPTRTTCPYCGVGCGVLATPDGSGGAAIAGDPEHPANFGRLCSKGAALGETLGLEGRLLHPAIGNREVAWDEALDHVAGNFQRIVDEHGPQAVAFYLSGQLLTEDYYVANKLAKGFLGTPHVDTNSRLCMASSVAGHRRAFGADIVPQSYEDLELADLVVLAGSNAAWCHPVLYQRIQAARAERGVRVVTIDPRRTATSEGADLHLAIRPGTDAQLWNGLLVWLADNGLVAEGYVERTPKALLKPSRSRARMPATSLPSRRRPGFPPPTSRPSIAGGRHRARRQLLLAGRQPVGAGHRQGQCHHQLPPGDRPRRQARLGPSVADRPAQRHGRARGGRARQHAGRAHGLRRARARPGGPLLGGAEPREGRRPQGGGDVRGDRRR